MKMVFVCSYCSKQFSSKSRVKAHIVKKVCVKKVHRCWCGIGCLTLKALKVHNLRHHIIRAKLKTTSISFANFSEFALWKQSVEDETLSKFVKPRTFIILKNGSKKTKYVCHRSGKMRLKTEERKRAKRKKGSCKLNVFCPAFISIEEDMNGFIQGVYYEVHNHENEIQHLTLSQKEKEEIAESLNKGATFEEILEDARNGSKIHDKSNRQKRIHMLTRKDLHNIMQEFKISFKERLARDATDIHSLVQECDQYFKENSPIRLFKPQNIDGVERMEGAEDFILIIMTATQKQMLKYHEHNQICVDSTHGMRWFDFHLTTVLTISSSGSSLPVAFCISNTYNDDIINIFFSIIKKECGNIMASVFTSKDFPTLVNVWCKVMGVPEKWQIDKNLQENLQKMIINGERDRTARTILKEIDDQLLTPLMQKFVSKLLENESTKEIGQFLVNEYVIKTSEKPDCYKKHVYIHTNLKLEAMHRALKDIYFKGLKVRRLDFSIFRLLKMCWDNLFERLAFLAKESDEYLLKVLKDRHNVGMSIPHNNILREGQSYKVKSLCNIEKTFSVERKVIDCSCQLRCVDCATCLHIYSCTCIDYSIARNVCQHVHAVCVFEKSSSKFLNPDETDPKYLVDEWVDGSVRTKHELMDALLSVTQLIQTNIYDLKVYEEGVNIAKKALSLLCKNNFENTLGCPKQSYDLITNEMSVISSDHEEIDAEDPLGRDLQMKAKNLMLVDDVIEEIIYVDLHPSEEYRSRW